MGWVIRDPRIIWWGGWGGGGLDPRRSVIRGPPTTLYTNKRVHSSQCTKPEMWLASAIGGSYTRTLNTLNMTKRRTRPWIVVGASNPHFTQVWCMVYGVSHKSIHEAERESSNASRAPAQFITLLTLAPPFAFPLIDHPH